MEDRRMKSLIQKEKYKAIGVMSGTSLDGLDIAAVDFILHDEEWKFSLISAETVPYKKNWVKTLTDAPYLSGEELTFLHSKYGEFLGNEIKRFLHKHNYTPDIIASHGHTVFHLPDKGYTLQIGNGANIAAITNILTVSDFRSSDVALGGQGAPLVPVGDRLLFSEFDYCLNLGGFANISFENNGNRIAFDICPVNIVLNYFAQQQELPYDKDGNLGKKGKINYELLEGLNQIPYYHIPPPKSLGREWVENEFFPVLEQFNISDSDKLRTVYEHIAIHITKPLTGNKKILITGGGAFNSFLIERIKANQNIEVIAPSPDIANFKEAIIFAFLGILRIKNINNCLASATGASKDHCSGIIFQP